MTLKFNDKEFPDAVDVICGFTTPNKIEKGSPLDQEPTHFNLIASPDLQFNTAMQLVQSITLNLLSIFINTHPEAKEHVYDAYNMMASSILEHIMPESTIPLNIEEEAILRTEEQLINERYEELTEEQKQLAKERLEIIKQRLLNKDTATTENAEQPSTL